MGEWCPSTDPNRAQSVSQLKPYYHTPSKEHTAHTHTLLWSSFKCAARISASSSFFWMVVVLEDGLLLLFHLFLPIFLLAQIL